MLPSAVKAQQRESRCHIKSLVQRMQPDSRPSVVLTTRLHGYLNPIESSSNITRNESRFTPTPYRAPPPRIISPTFPHGRFKDVRPRPGRRQRLRPTIVRNHSRRCLCVICLRDTALSTYPHKGAAHTTLARLRIDSSAKLDAIEPRLSSEAPTPEPTSGYGTARGFFPNPPEDRNSGTQHLAAEVEATAHRPRHAPPRRRPSARLLNGVPRARRRPEFRRSAFHSRIPRPGQQHPLPPGN